MEYHRPDVVKALAFHKYLKSRDAVAADLRGCDASSLIRRPPNGSVLQPLLLLINIAIDNSPAIRANVDAPVDAGISDYQREISVLVLRVG
jgi:hypothetical protein